MATPVKQEEQAYRLLEYPERYPGLLKRREGDRKLLLFRYPSSSINTSWSLFETEEAFWLRRIDWDRSKWCPLEDVEPFTFGCEISCSPEFVKDILSSLSVIKFCPFKQPELIGIDGTFYGIKIEYYWLCCSVRWWEQPNDDWKPLAQWFDKTVKVFEQILPQSTCNSLYKSAMNMSKFSHPFLVNVLA